MPTICINNEVNRSVLYQALIDLEVNDETAQSICDADEEEIWGEVFGRFHRHNTGRFDYQTSWNFRDWNGGRCSRRGHRIGVVHSDKSMDEADEVNTEIMSILESVLNELDWETK